MIPLARSNAEAHLFMELTPCGCGDWRFDRRSAVVTRGDVLCSEYTGPCQTCGTIRTFVFRLPERILPPGEVVRFGDDRPSELLDAGEWLAVADERARRRPATPRDLETAAAAIDEILKLAAPDGEIPDGAFRTARGRAVRDAEPGRFRRARLEAVLATYRAAVVRSGQMPGGGS